MPTQDRQALEAQALEKALLDLARKIANQPASPLGPAGPHDLVLRSGVSMLNDNLVGRFNDYQTAQLCARFLMAIDSVYHPEYRTFDLTPAPAQA